MIAIKRVYDLPEASDGYRVLVDRLWPRGVSKEKAALDEWRKEVAPSDDLRTWFGHDPDRFAEFRKRYRAELHENPALAQLKTLVTEHKKVTLLYAAHDSDHNNAVVLAELLQS